MVNSEFEKKMALNSKALKAHANRYYNWNLSLFPIEKNSRILDVGCGLGLYFDPIMRFTPSRYFATDHSDNVIRFMSELIGQHENCTIMKLDLLANSLPEEIAREKFDHILCFDVLEHLHDQERALKNLYHIMVSTQARHIFIRVPALQSIYGKNDFAIGHFRRYGRKKLKRTLESNSFVVEKIHYQNMVGIIPWLIIGKILKRSLAVSGNEGKLFDSLVPFLRMMENIVHPPIGLSLYAVARIAAVQ